MSFGVFIFIKFNKTVTVRFTANSVDLGLLQLFFSWHVYKKMSIDRQTDNQ